MPIQLFKTPTTAPRLSPVLQVSSSVPIFHGKRGSFSYLTLTQASHILTAAFRHQLSLVDLGPGTQTKLPGASSWESLETP